jgi:hypothetical protein
LLSIDSCCVVDSSLSVQRRLQMQDLGLKCLKCCTVAFLSSKFEGCAKGLL